MQFKEWRAQFAECVLHKKTWDLNRYIYISDSVSWRSDLQVWIYLMSVVGVLMYIPRHITAVLSVVSLLVEASLNSRLKVLPRETHLQSGHKVPKHLTLHMFSTCLKLIN